MITERDYVAAIWRLKKHRVPDHMDWLHDAVIEYYKAESRVDDGPLGNWLALVAWRKWQDYKRKLGTRVTVLTDRMDCFESASECKPSFDWRPVFSRLSPKQRDTLLLWKMGLNQPESAKAVGVTTQAMSQRRGSLVRHLKKRLMSHGEEEEKEAA